MKDPHAKFDWFGFWLHFAFGFLIGAGLGFYAWGRSEWGKSVSIVPGIFLVGGGGLLAGILAGLGQQEFWESFGPGLRGYSIAIVIGLTVALLVFLCYLAIGT